MNNDLERTENLKEITPQLYSPLAIKAFSVFFTTIFGGVLLMQNLKDIGEKKAANKVLLLSILYTLLTIILVNIPEKPITAITIMLNLAGGSYLSMHVFEKYIPDSVTYEKKKIWKPLIISILITIPFALSLFYTALQ